MSDYDVSGVFAPEELVDAQAQSESGTPTEPSVGSAREVMERAFLALTRAMENAESPSDVRQAANALLKFLQSQGVEWAEGEREEWMPPPEYNANLVYHLALLFGEGGLSEDGTQRTGMADAAVRASAWGHKKGPVFRNGVGDEHDSVTDTRGEVVTRPEGPVYTKAGSGRGVPAGWKGAQLVETVTDRDTSRNTQRDSENDPT